MVSHEPLYYDGDTKGGYKLTPTKVNSRKLLKVITEGVGVDIRNLGLLVFNHNFLGIFQLNP